MVQKIITAFKATHETNLSNDRIKKLAEVWATKIENEENVEEYVKSLDIELIKALASAEDALRKPQPKPEDTPPTPPTEKEDEIPEWKVEMDKMRAELDLAKQANTTSKRKETLNSVLSGANEAFLKTINRLDVSKYTDDEFEALKTELITDAESFKIDASKTTPLFGASGTPTAMKTDKAKEIASKIQ